MWSRNNQARRDINQCKIDSGLISKHFPDVSSIVIHMMYKQKGIANPIQRVMNFFPGSYAFFRVDCLSEDCVDGFFDMTQIINSMIGSHSSNETGELCCNDSGPNSDHSSIKYDIQIQFS